jgi:hypothetical protein
MKDYSYLGSGIVLIREWNSNGIWEELGNTSAFSINPQVNTLQLPDYQNPGGGIQNRVDRITDWQLNLTFHDINTANLARFTRGKATPVSAATVSAEAHHAYKGSYVPLKYPATKINSVTGPSGSPSYTVDTDYFLDRGMVFIPATSSIPNGDGATPNIEVNYDHADIGHVEAGVTSQKFYELHLQAANEAGAGKLVQVRAHKINGGMLESLSLLGDEYASATVTQSLVKDSAKKTSADHSEYFYWNQEEDAVSGS